jgi:transcriptional regulatory protein RtcR
LQTAPPRKQSAGEPGTYALIDLDLSKYNQIASRFAREHADAVSMLKSGIATRNPRFNALIEEIEHVSVRSKAPMLLMGPTGAGKSFLAKRIYELKRAKQSLAGPFVEVNCATLGGDGAASALFGHTKGAFTGAASERAGLLRSANKGLLFLDEIGELGLDEQAMLLKAIEEKTFYPVGADREVASDFQLIAGTNRDLRQAVRTGAFRDDLLARINLWTYALPSLAERREDIEPNIAFTLAQFESVNQQSVRFNKEAKERYMQFAKSPQATWASNFRDLTASVSRMATLAENGRITDQQVADEIGRLEGMWAGGDTIEGQTLTTLFDPDSLNQIDLFDRLQLEGVLRVCKQSKSLADAGRTLFAASRSARASTNDSDRLRKYLARFGLSWEQVSG